MLFISCERIEIHELLRFHTGTVLSPGFKGQGQAEDAGFGRTGQDNEACEYPESILRFIILSLQ